MSPSPAPSPSIDTLALEHRVDALFARCTKQGSPGAIVAVMQGGTIALRKGYGLASIELGVPIGPHTFASPRSASSSRCAPP
jgi:CubicO group peptidase (beta-lactamase class C family)